VGEPATVDAFGLDAACADCSRSQSARDGARFSTAQDSRCRTTDRCASQHDTLQNTNPVRGRLQVDTLHTQCCTPNAIGVLHDEQRRQLESSLIEPLQPPPAGAGRQVIVCQVIRPCSVVLVAASLRCPSGPGEQGVPRRPRIDFPGAFHHVIVRGVDRREIFLDDADRVAYCDQLSRVFGEDGAACLAWALMPNHVHLVVRTGPRPLARVMHRVGTRYGRYFNQRHARVGYLFQGRYQATTVADDAYLMTLVRYVHANPLRAGLVAAVEELDRHRWTGHAALVGVASAAPFHDVREALRLFSENATLARATVRALMECADEASAAEKAERTESEAGAAKWDPAASPVATWREIDPAKALAELVARVCANQRIAEADLRSGARHRPVSLARATVAHLAFHELGMSLAETARHFGVSRQALWARLEDGRRAASRLPRSPSQ
jgi:REP element-mobilizing transposase RayT